MKINFTSGLSAPNLSVDSRLTALLDSVLRKKIELPLPGADFAGQYWDDTQWGLDRSAIFRSMSSASREQVLRRLSQQSLTLAYFIEKSGLHFGAKMILLAESVEEKSLYSLMVGEETLHRKMIELFLVEQPGSKYEFHPLLPALSEIITGSSREVLIFIVQVLLEGFGIMHYHSLREGCKDPQLRAVFTNVLQDEANHHGSGLLLWSQSTVSANDHDRIFEATRIFMKALVSANWVSQAIEAEGRAMTNNEKEDFLREIDWEGRIGERLKKIRTLIEKSGHRTLTESLEREHLFAVAPYRSSIT